MPDKLPCGHDKSDVHSSGEGTSYCVKCAEESNVLNELLDRIIGTGMPTQQQILLSIRNGLALMSGQDDPMTMNEIIMLVDLAINHEENT